MPAPVSYPIFLANAQAADIRLLTDFVQGVRIQTADGAEADAIFDGAVRLYSAGLVEKLHRIYEEKNNTLTQSFDGYVTAVGRAYLAQLANERLVLSRDPIPAPEPTP